MCARIPKPRYTFQTGVGPKIRSDKLKPGRNLKKIFQGMYPQLNYHPLILPENSHSDLDPQTMDIIKATFALLNASNPTLAQDCWLCLPQGQPRPIAIPTTLSLDSTDDCHPFKLTPSTPSQCNLPLYSVSHVLLKITQTLTTVLI